MRRRTVLIIIAALVCGAVTAALILSSDHLADRAVWAVFGPAVGGASSAPGCTRSGGGRRAGPAR